MPEHSPEPWTISGYQDSWDDPIMVKSADRETVWHEQTDCNAFPSPEDRRRIVACVNACQGIKTKDLERCVSAAYVIEEQCLMVQVDRVRNN